jgi:hypothetical protein
MKVTLQKNDLLFWAGQSGTVTVSKRDNFFLLLLC